MEVLKKYNIKYLSPSSISLFISNPADYVLQKYLDINLLLVRPHLEEHL